MQTWVESAREDRNFTIHNIPFGLVSTKNDSQKRPATRLGDYVVDLSKLAKSKSLQGAHLSEAAMHSLSATTLEDMATLPASERRNLRKAIQAVFAGDKPDGFADDILIHHSEAQMHVPMRIGDYTDFCIAVEHMMNASRTVTGEASIPPQMPYMPIGYHGRSSSIVISGTPFKRPLGQYKLNPKDTKPVFGASRRLDYEVEMAFFVAKSTKLGERVTIEEAEDAIFGAVIMNDWSARDIQAYEMMPLGPFEGKNFATTISPWVVTLDALEPFKKPLPERLSPEFPHLNHASNMAYDINLTVEIEPTASKGAETQMICPDIVATDFYWSMPQLLVHQTISGCPVNVGDLIATGTCSGKTKSSLGSIVEYCEGGRNPWTLSNGEQRTFLEDGDNVIMRGFCSNGDGIRLGFGECAGLVLPADKV